MPRLIDMYKYDHHDQQHIDDRVDQFRDQTRRFLANELTEDEFRPLRLQNGLYIQRHAPMLRIAIPYGTLSANQLTTLADITDEFDDGYGHFSTRQNLQLNGPKLEQVPDILAKLATVQMHAIQTSGNCVRNITTDHMAGVGPDEIADPRPIAELIRQWSSQHPEFAHLPRKFKIALTASPSDRAAILVHDIGIALTRDNDGEIAFDVYAGGGLGRTPIVAELIRSKLPRADLLNYLEAILRVYNQLGRRDNLYKARIKILVRSMGVGVFANAVEREFDAILVDGSGPGDVETDTYDELDRHFAVTVPQPLSSEQVADAEIRIAKFSASTPGFSSWLKRSRHPNKTAGYAAVSISLKNGSQAPGDCTSEQMRTIAQIARDTDSAEIRVSHHQNLMLPNVPISQLSEIYRTLHQHKLASPNIGLLTDIIACPGGDFCSLANAVSIPIALDIQETFDDLDMLFSIGELELNISGCMNSCGHHHVGHIGILGVDKKGESFYQVSVGGSQGPDTRLAKILGPSFAQDDIPHVIEKLIRVYLSLRYTAKERFVDVVTRVGLEPFKEAVYVHAD